MYRKLIYSGSFILILSMILTNVSHAGLVAWWKFEEGSGDIAYDSSGNDHHGTLLGTPEWVLGPEGYGGALAFNPDRCTGVDCGIFDPTNSTGQFTIALWAFWDGTGTFQHFFSKSNGWGGDSMMFQVELWGAHTNPIDTDRVGISYSDNPGDCCLEFFIMPKNEWVHLAVTFNGINAMFYLNGVDEIGPKPFSIGPNVDAMIELGYTSTRVGAANRTFHGILDEIIIYDRPLSEQEIQLLMAGGEIQSNTAALPKPANRETEVAQDAALSWIAGDYADKHDVYFGKSLDDVNNASRDSDPNSVLLSQNQDETTFEPSGLLEFAQSYYWRVDEFNDVNPDSPWKGNVWSFQVINYFVVDDFEDYNDYPPNDIFGVWKDGYDVDINGALIGYGQPDIDAGEHFVETEIIHGGKQSMPYLYNNIGTATHSEAECLLNPAQNWTRESVETLSLWFRGNRAYVSSFTEETDGTYTMTAAGTDIWASADEFHFVFKQVDGSGAIVAKVESIQHTDPWSKAGVMIRDTLDADSRNVAVFVTPENGVRFQYRSDAGTATQRHFAEGITAPQWVKLERTVGGLVRAYYSADGTTWERFNLTQVRMDMPIYIGLAVTSHNADVTCEAKFSNVSFPDISVDPQWNDQDIGMLSNEAELMYVTVSDVSGTTATVYHPDNSASQIGDWTEWNIPLADFSNQGVALTDVGKLIIGFGDNRDPQFGGSGLVYFDDIRLYRPVLQEPEP